MRRFCTFLPVFALLWGLTGCASTPTLTPHTPDQRPGDFRLGVVVIGGDDEEYSDSVSLAGGDGRYIVDSTSVLRASFGAGSTLETYPGFTRRLSHDQMDALWLMAKSLLESASQDNIARLQAGQPQSSIKLTSGSIIEIQLNARNEVFVFEQGDLAAAAIIDALAALAWADID